MTPGWAIDALRGSAAPAWVVEALVTSVELGQLWERIPEARRRRVRHLPELIAGLLPTRGGIPQQGVTALPWYCENTTDQQTAAAQDVVEAAAKLNALLRTFAPLADLRLGQVFPHDDIEADTLLSGLRVAGHGDCLLTRLATMAEAFQPHRSAMVGKPNKATSKRTWLIRQCADIADLFAPWPRAVTRHAFVAGLVNVLDPAAEADARVVMASLRRVQSARTGST